MSGGKVAILIVTFNAPRCCWRLLRQLRETQDVDFTVNVVDNRSRAPTRLVLMIASLLGRIDRLVLLDRNTLFAEGCNRAASLATEEATHLLLLNPDIVIVNRKWLSKMMWIHLPGITSLGSVKGAPITRADGYCLLVDRDVWDKSGGLDENYQWWWSVTRLQASALRQGRTVQAVKKHRHLLRHLGGKSGSSWRGAKGMETRLAEVASWFDGLPAVTVIDDIIR